MDQKSWKWAILGLVIVTAGSVGTCLMGFPAGLLLTLPVGIPHALQIYRQLRNRR